MIAKVIAHGATREQALARLRGALRETVVLGVRTQRRASCATCSTTSACAPAGIDTGLVERIPVAAAPARRAARGARRADRAALADRARRT